MVEYRGLEWAIDQLKELGREDIIEVVRHQLEKRAGGIDYWKEQAKKLRDGIKLS